MIKKFFLVFLLLLFIFSANSTNCSFESNSCDRFSTSFNTFNLVFENSSILSSFSAKIYYKENPENKIRLIINQSLRQIKNLNPFTDTGVYILEVNAISKSGSKKISKFEFIFDNLEPIPPFIKTNLIGNTILGKTKFKNSIIIVKDINSNEITRTTSSSNNEFTLNLNLNKPINYVKFYTQNSNNILSVPLERIIFLNKIIEDKNLIVSNIVLDDLSLINYRTTTNLVTSKRNFLISGTVTPKIEGSIIYINGIKTLTDTNGKFMQFILLNEGKNTIDILDKDEKLLISKIITYINPRFKFLKLNIPKIISSSNLEILGKSNFDLPFNIYLNGNYIITNTPTNLNIDVTINNLIPGKNYLYIEGLNGEKFNKIIYYDTKKPQITLIIPNKISSSNDFIFEIKDDTSINISSVKVDFGNGKIFSGEQIEKIGDFYKVDISSLNDGDYNFIISANDLSGKNSILNSNLNIATSNTVIENIEFKNGHYIGNKLFLNSKNSQIILKPSRYISFKSIFLDSKRLTNYEILENGEVHINLDNLKDKGILNLTFVNNNLDEFNYAYFYYTDLEKPKINLDYILNSQTNINNYVKITGEIIDSNFDWTSLEFNNFKNFQRIGKYFEAYVKVSNNKLNDLNILGFDYSKNGFVDSSQTKTFGSILFLDNNNENINILNNNKNNKLDMNFLNGQINTKKYLTSYDGFDFNRIYLNENDFQLPFQDREGLRSLNLKGIKSSNLKFFSSKSFVVDNLDPIVYLVSDSNNLKLIFDGTLSSINKASIKILIDNSNYTQRNYCINSLSIFSNCLVIPQFNNLLKIQVNDNFNNTFSKTFIKSEIVPFSSLNMKSINKPKIYFSGNDLKTNNKNYFIQGQVLDFNKISSVKIGNNNCEFDDFNFVCQVNLNLGLNSFNVNVVDSNSQTNSKQFNIVYDNGNNLNIQFLNINAIGQNSLYKVGDIYYTTNASLNINAIVNNLSLIKLLVNGEEILLNKHNGNFNLNINLQNTINDKEKENLNLKLIAQDELGNRVESNSFNLIYQRIVKTLISIFII